MAAVGCFVHPQAPPASGTLRMMTLINWESLLKITHAENTFSCLPDLLPLAYLIFFQVGDFAFRSKADLGRLG